MGIERTLHCPFCPGTGAITVPASVPSGMARGWLEKIHFEVHVDDLLASVVELCPRCDRYAHYEPVLSPFDHLHRKCFAPACGCPCSFLSSLRPVFFLEPRC